MKGYSFVDADIFLNYFTGGDKQKAGACRKLFEDAVSGKVKLFSSFFVLAEVARILEEVHHWKKEEIAGNLKLVLNTPNLRFRGREMLFRVVDDYAGSSIDLVDAYHREVMREMSCKNIYTYRHGFDGFKGIKRLEP